MGQDIVVMVYVTVTLGMLTRITWKKYFSYLSPKPKTNEFKCKRWISACGREDFTVDRIKKWTYICSKHFVGGKGPTEEHPDPIPATYTPLQVFEN